MKKNVAAILLLTVFTVLLFTVCSSGKDDHIQTGPRSYSDYINTGKRIAVQAGDVYGNVANYLFKAKAAPEYTTIADMLEALRMGRVDAALLSHGYIRQLTDSGMYPDFDYLWVPKDVYIDQAAPIFHSEELRDTYNNWFRGIVADGTWQEIVDRWIGVPLPAQKDIPQFNLTGTNGTLKMCDTGNYPPLIYLDANGDSVGFDIDIMSRFAQHMGMKLDLTLMAYEAIVPYVISGKADMSACTLTVTDEREEGIIFGDPSVVTQAVLIVPKAAAGSSQAAARSAADFAGKDIAVITGALTWNTTEKINAHPVNYNDSSSAAEDVRKGRVAGYMHALTAVQVMASQLDGFEAVAVPKEVFSAQIGGISTDPDIIGRFNAFLAEISANGTLDDMHRRWFSDALDLDAPLPAVQNTGNNGVIKVAICSDSIPYVYVGANGGYSGFSTELALRFGAYEGKSVEFIDMEFGGLIPYIVSKKADIGLANLAITEERKKSVLFTDPIFNEQHGILALKQGGLAAQERNTERNTEKSYTDFNGKKIGALIGTICDQITIYDINGIPAYYANESAALEDVRKGRIDGYMTDSSAARIITASPGGEALHVVPIPAEIFAGPLGAFGIDADIINRFNIFLSQLRSDGTLAGIQHRWLETIPDLNSPMPQLNLTGKNGTLKVATTGGAVPFSYIGANGELKGYSIELARRFAAHEGMNIEFATMDFGGLINYVVSGKADFGIDAVTITEERKKSVLFTDSIFDDTFGIIARESKAVPDESALSYTGFAGRKMGIITGTAVDKPAKNILGADPVYYSDTANIIIDLRNGRIDGFLYDLSTIKIIAGLPENIDLHYIEIPPEVYYAPLGAVSANQNVIDRFNAYLKKAEADGSLEDMRNRWLESLSALKAPMPEVPFSNKNGVIKIAIDDAAVPFAYRGADGELRGFCVELAMRFANHEGMIVEFIPLDFGAMIPSVGNGKADLGIDAIFITEERKEAILFSDPFCKGPLGILALKQSAGTTHNYSHFIGKRFAVKNGTIYDYLSADMLNSSRTLLFEDYPSIYEAIQKGRADAGLRGYYAAYVSLFEPAYSNLVITAVPVNMHNNPIAAISMDQGIIDSFNEFLAVIKLNGIYDEMKARWFVTFNPGNIPDMPEIHLTGENGTLIAAISSDYMPFSFLGENGVNYGFDIELAKRFAVFMHKDIEFVDMAFSGLLPYIVSGKADIAISDITITDERKQSVLFTDPYFIDLSAIIYRRDFGAVTHSTQKRGFSGWLKTGIERNLITDKRWKLIVNGLGVTMLIALAAQFFGTIFGCFMCYLLTRKNKIAQRIGNFYCSLIHGTPVVVLLMITYYIIFGSTGISNVFIAIAAFTMVMGAGIAHNLKGAIDTVDPAEIEAARSMGFSAFRAFRVVTLPQAVRRALPGYTNGFVELVKETAIVGYIAIQDLTRAGDIIRSRTYDAYFPLLFVAVIYLIVTTICVQIFKLIVRRINGGEAQ